MRPNKAKSSDAPFPIADFWRSPWLAMAIAFGCCAVALFFCFPTYNTNDDVIIRLLLEGRAVPNGLPTPEVYFLNLWLARALVWLGAHWPAFHWYDTLSYAILTVSAFFSFRLVQKSISGNLRKAALAFMAAGFLALFAQPQFTATAIIATGLGTLICGVLLVGRVGQPARLAVLVWALAGGVLVTAGLLLRVVMAVVALGYVATCVLFFWSRGRGKPRRGAIAILASVIFVAAIAVAATAWFDHARSYGRSPEWRQFYEFNALRASLTEYNLKSTPGELAKPGSLSADDRAILSNWAYFDPAAFPLGKLKGAASLRQGLHLDGLSPWLLVKQWLRSLVFLAPAWLAITGLMLAGSAESGFGKRGVASAILLAAVFFCLTLFFKAPPWRVVWPIGMLQFLLVCCFFPASPVRTVAGSWLVAAAAACTFAIVAIVAAQNRRAADFLATDIARAHLERAPAVFSVGGGLPLEHLERPFSREYVQRGLKVVLLGTMTRSPRVTADIARIFPDGLASHICGAPGAMVLGTPPALDALRRYYKAYRGEAVTFERLYAGRMVDVYRCRIRPG